MIGTDSYLITIEFPDKEDKNSISDYRYSDIEVTVIDLTKMGNDLEPLKAQSLGKGIIRLYRELEDEDGEISSFNISDHPTELISGDDTMVAVVAVPTYFTATDLLGFIGESNMKHISHIRILKSDKPNRFLVLIKFMDIIKAAEFHHNFNGKMFNSMEPETCHVVYVKGVQVEHSDNQLDDRENTLIPFLLQDPFTSPAPSLPNSPNSKGFSLISTEKPLMELPSCPVCLERMDATVTGLLTIPCQHTFHCQCLSKWKDDTCPICRYSNNFSNLKVRRTVRRLSQIALPRRRSSAIEQEVPETCFDCTDNENLWICLICGNVGCSRYADGKHSLKHFIDTGHCFAMEVNTSRVWDYAGDNYVHRLVTNESDGKLVELPDKNSNSEKAEEKVDELGFEYSQLLVSQLASQRDYYESLLEEHDAPKSRRGSKPVDLETTVEKLTEKIANLTDQIVPSLREKISQKDAKLNSIYKELSTSNTINNALSAKVDYLVKSNEDSQSKIKQLEQENKALNEQVTDLMFFLDSQDKFKDEPQDVRDGTIVIQEQPKLRLRGNKKKL
ncbi:BRCA1-associated protein 2-domain-containing protein [Scheffersomyces coipomensis]|uniref:BRCA1-associated protein 2-domain-containing protein n=1 Tax=Scheffersomyces coipomensis TaxID=1788519 RepID=UPI00315D5433